MYNNIEQSSSEKKTFNEDVFNSQENSMLL